LLPQEFSTLVKDCLAHISLENLLPVSISHLPEEDLIAESVRFYLGAESLALNEHFPEPLLTEIGFADRIEIAVGQYQPGGESLFLVGYPTPKLAAAYFIKLQDRLQGFFSEQGVYMKRAGVLICIFVGPEHRAHVILPRVKYAPTIKWLYEKRLDTSSETLTFLGLITKTILGTGVFILVILGTGLVLGLVRYEVLRRFPGFMGKKEMVRLNLDRRERQ
jgi:hypothetical protein